MEDVFGGLMLLLGMEQEIDRSKGRGKGVLALTNLCMLMQIMLIYKILNSLFMGFFVMYLFVIGLKILIISMF